jgi:hypothetical protein
LAKIISLHDVTFQTLSSGFLKTTMPLYSYIACYRGGSYAEQDSRSNFKGFAPLMLGRLPANSLPGLDADLRRELVEKSSRSEWSAIPNRKNIWVMQIVLDGRPFTLHAVQTQN